MRCVVSFIHRATELRLRARWILCAYAILMALSARAETPRLADPADGPGVLKDYAPRTAAEVLDATTNAVAPGLKNLPRAGIAIDGEVYPGSWRKLEGRLTNSADASKITEVEWTQKAGPKTAIPDEFFKQAELWLFLIKPGNYAFTFRARNENGWGAPAEVRFAVMQGRPFLSEQDGFQRAGSCERIVLPGNGWRQIAGPAAAFRPAESGVAVRPNDAGLYVFEAPRLDGLPERRGILVPPAKDGKLGDRRPIANLPRTLNGFAGRPLILDGSLSMDPDDDDTPALKAIWTTPDLKRGATLDPQPGVRAVFKAERPGGYSASLIVSDGRLDSAPVTVLIDIAPGEEAGVDLTAPDTASEGDVDPAKIAADLLMQRVSLAIWPAEPLADGTLFIPNDSGLERAVQLFPNRCGVALVINPGVARPGHFKDFQLALEANKTPLRHLLDGIARQTGTRYRRDSDRAFYLIRAEDAFRDEKLESAAAGVDALHERADGSDLMAPLKQFFKVPLAAQEGTSISFEADQQAVVAMLPKTACARLREIAQVLREPAGIGLPIPEPPSKAEERLRRALGEKTVTLRGRFRIDRLFRDLAHDSGLAIGFDPKQFPRGLPYLKIAYENAPLRQVLRDLVDDAGFNGCSIEAPAGVWFYKGPRPFPTGELLWDSAEVRAYDLTTLFAALTPEAALFLSGEAIAHQVRSRVYPASWNDPGTLVFFHRGTQKLVVVHAPEAHRKIVELLNDMRDRGTWSLGASE